MSVCSPALFLLLSVVVVVVVVGFASPIQPFFLSFSTLHTHTVYNTHTHTHTLKKKPSIHSAYALVLSGNHVYTSGAGGTHAATIRGALRAEDPELLTVVLPQSLAKQPAESQQLLENVEGLIEMPQNDDKTLDVASRICNSYLVNQTDQMIAFAFHESSTVLEATREAREQNKPVTTLFLD